jgi:hypothetical protein
VKVKGSTFKVPAFAFQAMAGRQGSGSRFKVKSSRFNVEHCQVSI